MGGSPPLVSIVVPLYNGAATVERTLSSVIAQTWPNVEVIVVDDGSTDDGVARVEELAGRDRRVRLVRQQNAGVAAARNLGASHAQGDYIAFVDSDDLWAPDKIELQMAAAQAGGDKVGLVYTWAASIDAEDRVFSWEHRPDAEGRVFEELCRGNFVGNGSSALIRRAAFERVGGYDPSLRARGAEGCEDLTIYLSIAEHYEFRVVRRFLTGYRVTQDNMSSNARRMLRSCELALAPFRTRYPELAGEFDLHRRNIAYWFLQRALATGPLGNVPALLLHDGMLGAFRFVPKAPSLAWLTLRARAPAPLKRALRRLMGQEADFRPTYQNAFSPSPLIPANGGAQFQPPSRWRAADAFRTSRRRRPAGSRRSPGRADEKAPGRR